VPSSHQTFRVPGSYAHEFIAWVWGRVPDGFMSNQRRLWKSSVQVISAPTLPAFAAIAPPVANIRSAWAM